MFFFLYQLFSCIHRRNNCILLLLQTDECIGGECFLLQYLDLIQNAGFHNCLQNYTPVYYKSSSWHSRRELGHTANITRIKRRFQTFPLERLMPKCRQKKARKENVHGELYDCVCPGCQCMAILVMVLCLMMQIIVSRDVLQSNDKSNDLRQYSIKNTELQSLHNRII